VRPDFLVIGAPKCATTSLCFCLGLHPQVFVSRPKETFFFSHDEVWARGWGWYESLFAGSGGALARGEGTTVYAQTATYPKALPRIAEHLPHARILYIVREPYSRLESHWIELHSQGLTTLPFAEALRKEPELLDAARYGTQLEAYRAHFPDDRILVLFYEDYRERPHEVLERCFRFLGVDPGVRIEAAARPGDHQLAAAPGAGLLLAARSRARAGATRGRPAAEATDPRAARVGRGEPALRARADRRRRPALPRPRRPTRGPLGPRLSDVPPA
jgi:hypothetical protein